MRKAAEFREENACHRSLTKGDLSTPLDWECQFGHRFKASHISIIRRPLVPGMFTSPLELRRDR